MSQDFFRPEKGVDIDGAVRLAGTGVPGTGGDTDAVGVGSVYSNLSGPTTGNGFWVKTAAGTGTDKWTEAGTGSGGQVDYKDSVKLATFAALPAYTQAGAGAGATLTADAVGILTVDGVATVLDDDLLITLGAAGSDNGIYTVTTEGTAGVPFVLTRRPDADEDGEVTSQMRVPVEEGTENANSVFVLTTNDPIVVDTTAQNYTKFTDADTLAELQFIRTFIGKTGEGAETPTYSSNNVVTDTTSLEVAIGDLDSAVGQNQTDIATNAAEILEARTETSLANVTTSQTLDSVAVDTVAAVKWQVHCEGNLLADAAKKVVVEIFATHDGHNNGGGADAADADFTVFAKLRMGAALVGLTFTVDVNGAGGAQTMRLLIASTTAVDVRAIRKIINF